MKPYYDHAGVTIYHGDARDVLPALVVEGRRFDAIVTDPVWPGASVPLAGSEAPEALFRDVATVAPRLTSRLGVQLGRDTDPRMLAHVPSSLPFLCACWLRYDVPGYKGRILVSADVAYIFGEAPPVRPGAFVLPGEASGKSARAVKRVAGHPCPRRLDHVACALTRSGRPHVAAAAAVRRLTPMECERLQGFPDGWTALPGAADSPRYEALGNSVAVPVLEWIGRRLASCGGAA